MVQRIKDDFYETPAKLTRILLQEYPFITGNILEPCAGNNAIANELMRTGQFNLILSDIKTNPAHDATTVSYWQRFDAVDWVVTNPPFTHAADILHHALLKANKGVAMLLRITFLEPCTNRATTLHKYADNLVKIIPFNPRPKFRKDTKRSDSATVAWFIWNKQRSWRELGIICPFSFGDGWK